MALVDALAHLGQDGRGAAAARPAAHQRNDAEVAGEAAAVLHTDKGADPVEPRVGLDAADRANVPGDVGRRLLASPLHDLHVLGKPAEGVGEVGGTPRDVDAAMRARGPSGRLSRLTNRFVRHAARVDDSDLRPGALHMPVAEQGLAHRVCVRVRDLAPQEADGERRHREIVLTGINLGCFRDRERGYTLARLVREVGATPGLNRLRLSSIEINHVSEELVRALRETPTVARHLHVPLQSGDDGVLAAMGRRYTAGTYLRRLQTLTDFNLTTDVIVGFPNEDDLAFQRTRRVLTDAGVTKVHVFPYSPRPGTATADADSVPAAVKKERSARLRADSHEACLRRWRSKLGSEDEVLVDRPGRGYGNDYSPWLVDETAELGQLVRARASGVAEEGIVGVI